jgi:mRNA interferase HigB
MHVISRKALRNFAERRLDAARPLDDWYHIAKRAQWKNIADVKAVFPHADAVGKMTVFNIGGNKYRLVAEINYRRSKVYIVRVMTHAEYSREDLKKWGR